MNVIRTGKLAFGLAVLAVSAAALADTLRHGRLTFMPPLLLGVTALLGLGYLFVGLIDARSRERELHTKADELQAVTAKLEASLQAMSTMNARLNESEVRYKGLVDAQGDAICRRAPDSRLTYGNDAFFKLFGLDPRAAIGQAFAPEPHPNSRAPHFGSFAGQGPEGERARYDQHIRTAYGWRWIAWEDYAIRDKAGCLIEIQSVGRNITERKALEDALTDARDKAEDASRAKSGFLATMSHEIRTPMNGVLGMARLLLETPLQPEQQTYAGAIVQSGESLLALIEDILDFSKIEAGAVSLEEDEVDLRHVVGGVLELLAPRAHDKGIEIASVVAADVPRLLRADGVRLRQVLTNLVGNAVKFTERGGVCVSVHPTRIDERKFLRFEVRDTGVGVPEEKRAEIFNEFVQADSGHARRFGGSGLGLAISKRLVAAMGGTIGIDAPKPGGSIFWFTLPALVVHEADPGHASALDGCKIALVTRSAILRDALSEQVRQAGGEVVPLGTSPAGEIGEYDLDALLIDAGTGDAPELPASPDARILSIVLLTPGARSHLPRLKTHGFGGYLVKPLRATSLTQRILAGEAGDMEIEGEIEGEDSGATEFGAAGLPSPMPMAASAPPGGLRVLLAEDNPINAMLTRELLRRRGHQVTGVTSGEEALQALEDDSFDLVLTDIHMPGLDGIEATKRIRASEERRGQSRVPVVALTADALETGKRACQDAGMDGFLTKPVNPTEFDAMLAELFPTPDGKTRDAAA